MALIDDVDVSNLSLLLGQVRKHYFFNLLFKSVFERHAPRIAMVVFRVFLKLLTSTFPLSLLGQGKMHFRSELSNLDCLLLPSMSFYLDHSALIPCPDDYYQSKHYSDVACHGRHMLLVLELLSRVTAKELGVNNIIIMEIAGTCRVQNPISLNSLL